jgi:cell division protein FtsN
MKRQQSGNILIGLIIGLVLGLGIALGIAVYVTKVPIPFMTKTQRAGPEQDEAEARKNRVWDPNAPLAGKSAAPARPPLAAATPAAPATAAATTPQPATASPENPPQTAPVPVVVAPAARGADAASPPARPARTAPVPAEANATPQSSDPLGDLVRARAFTTTSPAAGAPAADPFIYFVQAGAYRTPEDAEAQRAKLSLMGIEARVTEREQAGRTVYRVRAGPFNRKEDADQLKERLDGGGLESALVRVQR